MTFKSYDLPAALIQVLEQLNITTPTPVQEKAIPAALAGKDVLATAQTGTGKTMAYLLPIVTRMQDNAHEQALILAPTRELAEQIKNALVSLLGRKGQHDAALLIGGASIYRQFMALKKRPRYIIGTPGRIIDHLERGKLTLHDVRYLVLDEMDRMLDMGFTEALETIMQDVPKERQSLMFSATLPPNIAKMSKKYMSNPEHITIGSVTQASLQIKQEMLRTSAGDKFNLLVRELEAREGSVIIFMKTKISADILAEKLHDKGHEVAAIHGDLRQRQRDAVIRAFRKNDIRILVATDVAARGLDIPHIKHVINYDLPQCAEDYIHRIGRTGRAGMEGFALSFVLPSEGGKWRAIDRLLNSDPSTAYKGDNQGGGDWERGGRRSGPRRGGSGRYESRGGDRDRDRGRSFGRDRSESSEGRRPPREGGRFGDRPARSEGSEGRRPPREGGRFGDKPRFEGASEGRRPPREGGRFGDKPRFEGASEGRRPPREGGRFGDRPARSEGASEGRRPPREGGRFGDRPPRFEGASEGRRPPREGGRFGDRPAREGASEGRRPPREGGRFSDRPRTEGASEGRRPPREGGRFSDKSKSSEGRRTSSERPTKVVARAKSPKTGEGVSVRVRRPAKERS